MLRRAFASGAALRRLRLDQRGSTAIEYALIASLIGMGILAGLTGTSGGVADSFQTLLERVAAVMEKKG